MDNEREKEVEDLEQKAKFTIITMECDDDDENGRSKKILDDAAIQLQRLFRKCVTGCVSMRIPWK